MTYLLSINPYLGPLQIALGKMIIDIVKWMFLFLLVVFAFGCGMTQLLSYYAELEMQQCYRYQHNEQLKSLRFKESPNPHPLVKRITIDPTLPQLAGSSLPLDLPLPA